MYLHPADPAELVLQCTRKSPSSKLGTDWLQFNDTFSTRIYCAL